MSGPGIEGGPLPRRNPELLDRYETEIERLVAARDERIRRLAGDDIKLHLHAPGGWVCIDDADEWPCDGAKERLTRQIPVRSERQQYMVKCWRQAVSDLGITDPDEERAMYTRFVAWTEEPRR